MESPKESIHAYKKTRDRALLPSVYVALAFALLFFCRGLWNHDTATILAGFGLLAGAGFFYLIYRKTLI